MARRRLGARRTAWGAAIAVACTAAMIAITVPLQASGDDGTAAPSPSGSATSAEGTARNAPAAVEEPLPASERGSGRDPLTPGEVKRARALAVDDALREKTRDVHGEPGPEYLRTELAEQGAARGGSRRAEVYFYDYAEQTTVKRVIDLGTGKVVSSDSATGLQPPPSAEETREAVKLLLRSRAGDRLKSNYRDATDRALARPGQLHSTGMAYTGAGASGGDAASEECATHRCLSLFTRVDGGGPWIDMTDVVVDLSDRKVSRVG